MRLLIVSFIKALLLMVAIVTFSAGLWAAVGLSGFASGWTALMMVVFLPETTQQAAGLAIFIIMMTVAFALEKTHDD